MKAAKVLAVGFSGGLMLATSVLAAEPLMLQCPGEAEIVSSTTDDVTTYNRDKHRSETRTESHTSNQMVSVIVKVELADVSGAWQGRIHLPGNMVPAWNSGGDDGWWPLKNIAVAGDTVTATYKLNGLNEVDFRLDRATGDLSLKGLKEYSGTCSRATSGRLF